MEVILRINGIGVVEDRGLYRIVPIERGSEGAVPRLVRKGPGQDAGDGKVDHPGGAHRLSPVDRGGQADHPFSVDQRGRSSTCPRATRSSWWIRTRASSGYFSSSRPSTTRRRRRSGPGLCLSRAEREGQGHSGTAPADISRWPCSGGGHGHGHSARCPRAFDRGDRGGAPSPCPLSHGDRSCRIARQPDLVSDITKIYADEIINSIIVLSTPED